MWFRNQELIVIFMVKNVNLSFVCCVFKDEHTQDVSIGLFIKNYRYA